MVLSEFTELNDANINDAWITLGGWQRGHFVWSTRRKKSCYNLDFGRIRTSTLCCIKEVNEAYLTDALNVWLIFQICATSPITYFRQLPWHLPVCTSRHCPLWAKRLLDLVKAEKWWHSSGVNVSSAAAWFNVLTFSGTLQPRFFYLTVAF